MLSKSPSMLQGLNGIKKLLLSDILLQGLVTNSIIIAIISSYLELTNVEELLHLYVANDIYKDEVRTFVWFHDKLYFNFQINLSTTNQIKNAAANVIKHSWLSYKYSKTNKKFKTFIHQRKLNDSIEKCGFSLLINYYLNN